MTNDTTRAPIGADALMHLVDTYAETRHIYGDASYNAKSKEARDAVRAALASAAQPSDAAWETVLRERDDADDFIDALLDEVLGADRPEWSNLYGRADALNDVRERMDAAAAPKAAQPVASIYVTPSGEREMDDWKVELPVSRNELYTAPASAPAAQGDALPVAAKSHGAWDGLETLADLPDGTELYAHPPAAQGDALDRLLRFDAALRAVGASLPPPAPRAACKPGLDVALALLQGHIAAARAAKEGGMQ